MYILNEVEKIVHVECVKRMKVQANTTNITLTH